MFFSTTHVDKKGCVCDDLFVGEKCQECAVPGHLYPKCATPMPPAIIPVNKNRAVVHVVWGIQTIIRRGGILPKGGIVDKIDR